ncbi:MAG: aspartyl protease family protein [Chloroflexi bacterium]|nr:aspartyl protease family protein [Chloroflexota bacterium]
MGYVTVRGLIGSTEVQARDVEFLADTGSFATILPPALARELGITPTLTTRLVVADSRQVEAGAAAAYLRLHDREGAVLVAILDVPVPLLGASALEALGFKVNPVDGTLEPTRPFGPAAL